MNLYLIAPQYENDKIKIGNDYINFFREMKIELITIDYRCDLKALKKLIKICSGLILPGGDDYFNYHIDKNYNRDLDDFEFKLISSFIEENKPIIGICRGIQGINLYFDGTLKPYIKNHQNTYHLIKNYEVNKKLEKQYYLPSNHHQSINKLANNFDVVFYSDDNEIEGIKHRFSKIVGFQFHIEKIPSPERKDFQNYLLKLLNN